MNYQIQHGESNLQVYAKGNLKSQTLIIFLHGGPGSGAQAIMDLPAFQSFEEDYLCIHFDQRGSGKSEYDLKKGLSIEQIVADVQRVVEDSKERWNPQKIILWGGSFGGLLACLYCQRHETSITSLILSNPAISFTHEDAVALFRRRQTNIVKRIPLAASSVNQIIENVEPKQILQDETIKNFIYSESNPSNSLRHVQAMSSWFFNYYFANFFNHLDIPTLIVNGKEDTVCDCQSVVDEIEKSQNSKIELHVLSPCGHAVFEDQKEAFTSLCINFIKQLK